MALAMLLATLPAGALASESGDAEEAPESAIIELAETRHSGDSPSMQNALTVSGPAVSAARVHAHTAQLQTPPTGKPVGKPLFPVEIPVMQNKASQSPASSEPAKASRPQLNASKAKARRARLPLAPTAAEIRREIAARNGGPETSASSQFGSGNPDKPKSVGARLEDKATATPTQNTRWPTHVDYSTGPNGPAGANTAADRKGTMIEFSGPEQGVLRNRW
jgi:hypothetical protein